MRDDGGHAARGRWRVPELQRDGRARRPVEERFGGYIDGPEPAATRLAGARRRAPRGSGWPISSRAHLFSERFKGRERDALRDMEDGLLDGARRPPASHPGHGRRGPPAGVVRRPDPRSGTTWRSDELRWRRRAGTRAAIASPPTSHGGNGSTACAASVDLGSWLIAYECDKARSWWIAATGSAAARSTPTRRPIAGRSTSPKASGSAACCNVGGDAFTYVELRYGLDFAEAVRHLEQRL
jgi:hypothetical protein